MGESLQFSSRHRLGRAEEESLVHVFRLVCLTVVCLAAGRGLAQDSVDARLTGERIILVVPFVGAGTIDDPKRPLFAPKPGEDSPVEGFAWVPTDSGKLAIVVLDGTAPRRSCVRHWLMCAFEGFQKGKHTRDEVEGVLKKLKKDFSLEQFLGGVQ